MHGRFCRSCSTYFKSHTATPLLVFLFWQAKWVTTCKIYYRIYATSKYSDQPAHSRSLLRILAWHSVDSEESKVSSCGQRRLWSDCADAQSDLSLRWVQMSEQCGSNLHIFTLSDLRPATTQLELCIHTVRVGSMLSTWSREHVLEICRTRSGCELLSNQSKRYIFRNENMTRSPRNQSNFTRIWQIVLSGHLLKVNKFEALLALNNYILTPKFANFNRISADNNARFLFFA